MAAALGCLLAALGCGGNTAGAGAAGPSSPPAHGSRPPALNSPGRPTNSAERDAPLGAALKAADGQLSTMTTAQEVGQLLMPYFYGAAADAVDAAEAAANVRSSGASTAGEMIARYHLGGVILIQRPDGPSTTTHNLDDPAQITRLTAQLQQAAHADGQYLPLLISTDQEEGIVTRIGAPATLLPGNMALGAAADPALTQAAAAASGGELATVGVNMDMAPDADVLTAGPANTVIGSRSFGADPQRVAEHTKAALIGFRQAGVAAVVKHFPGHGSVTLDSHDTAPVITGGRELLVSRDLPPFQAALSAGAEAVMVGHLRVASLDASQPATYSPALIDGLLRRELGFSGVVVTDALRMGGAREYPPGEAAVRAILAGADILLMPSDLAATQQGLLAAVETGRLSKGRLDESVRRVLRLKARLSAQPPIDAPLGSHQALANSVALAAVTVVSGPCSGRLLPLGPVRLTGGTDAERSAFAAALASHGEPVTMHGPLIQLVDAYQHPSGAAAAAVALDVPWPLDDIDAPVRLAAFSNTPASLAAVAAVLAGDLPARGVMPVPMQHGCG